jgi:hypothetical protein
MATELPAKKLTLIYQSLTALAERGSTLTYNLLLLDKELCVQITNASGGSEFDKHIYPVFVEPSNDVNGYKKDSFDNHESTKAPQPAFLRAIRKSIKQKLNNTSES